MGQGNSKGRRESSQIPANPRRASEPHFPGRSTTGANHERRTSAPTTLQQVKQSTQIITAITADWILNIYHDKIARGAPMADLDMNCKFALGFVNKVKIFFLEEYDLNVEIIPVGSAFEDLKVHQPDEFDFLVVIMVRDSDDQKLLDDESDHEIIDDMKTMKRKLGDDADVLNGYHPILLSRRDCVETPAYRSMRENWSGLYENFGCLSAEAARDTLHHYVAEFVEAWNHGEIQLPGVTAMEAAIKGNPAIKLTIHKLPLRPLKISIDLSPCVRIASWNGTSNYFIAKRKQALKLIPGTQYDPRYKLLWFLTESPDEKYKITAKQSYERRNLRILKSLFKDMVRHTHIWKRIFMSDIANLFPQSPIKFIKLFIDTFNGWLQVELARRYRRNPIKSSKCDVAEQPPSQYYKGLVAGFNEYENILVRYEDKEIITWYKKFKKLSSHLAEGNFDQFLWNTIGEENWAKLKIKGVEFSPGDISDSESEEDSSDSSDN